MVPDGAAHPFSSPAGWRPRARRAALGAALALLTPGGGGAATAPASPVPAVTGDTVRFVLTQTLVRPASAGQPAGVQPSPASVVPGDLLQEDIAVTNVGPAALRGVLVAVPVPGGAVYAGSATPAAPGWTLQFSTDRGRSYAARPSRPENVTENGRTVRRQVSASADTYTHVRWRVATLRAGETLKFSFRVRVRAAEAQGGG